MASEAKAPPAGRVLRLEISDRVSPTFEGAEFGAAGAYECLTGSAWCDLYPLHPLNRGIVNLEHVPRDADGRVGYRVDFCTIKPIDLARGNGWLFYELPNRGTKRAIQRINSAPPNNRPSTLADAGNGYLLRQGYTLVWSGWQGDLVREPGRMLADLPTPLVHGNALTGHCREEYLLDAKGVPQEDTNEPLRETSDSSFVAGMHYATATVDPGSATLTVRARDRDARQSPPDLRWRFLDDRHIEITRPAGFDRGAIYEFIYHGRDPVVMGIGLASIRDILSFLRNETHDHAGNANPLMPGGRTPFRHVLGFGLSQSGRVLREFLHGGFNADGEGRRVFDAAVVVVAGARNGLINAPFAQATRASRQHGNHTYPGDQFPFAYPTVADPISGRTGGIMAAAEAASVAPKLMHLDTESEIWTSRASLVVTDCAGKDIAQPDNVRIYLANGVPHLPYRQPEAVARYASNPLSYHVIVRALLVAMREWVERGELPPASRFPSRAGGTLVSVEAARAMFPSIRGGEFPRESSELRLLDHSVQPPKEGPVYPTFVTATDADGNGLGGVRHPLLLAPVGTHTGWQLRREGYAGGELYNVFGAYLPFAATRAEREAAGDSRPSLEERYGTRDAWREMLRERMAEMVADRLLLQEDANRVLAAAGDAWEIFTSV